jgi:hypothetical protein
MDAPRVVVCPRGCWGMYRGSRGWSVGGGGTTRRILRRSDALAGSAGVRAGGIVTGCYESSTAGASFVDFARYSGRFGFRRGAGISRDGCAPGVLGRAGGLAAFPGRPGGVFGNGAGVADEGLGGPAVYGSSGLYAGQWLAGAPDGGSFVSAGRGRAGVIRGRSVAFTGLGRRWRPDLFIGIQRRLEPVFPEPADLDCARGWAAESRIAGGRCGRVLSSG